MNKQKIIIKIKPIEIHTKVVKRKIINSKKISNCCLLFLNFLKKKDQIKGKKKKIGN